MRRLVLRAALGLVVALGLLKLAEPFLVYPLDPRLTTPDDHGLSGYTVLTVKSRDGTPLTVWHHPPESGETLVLYFPGNAGHLGNRARRLDLFDRAGLGVAALAWRGSTGAPGRASEARLREDAQALVAAMRRRHPGTPVAYYGESLGTGVATWLASVETPARVVLEAPYTSIPDAALKATAPGWVAAIFANRWESKRHIRAVTAPILILHGTEDQVIPYWQGEALAGIASDQAELFTVAGADHFTVWTPDAQRRLLAFLDAAATR